MARPEDVLSVQIDRWHPSRLNQLLKNRWQAYRLKKRDREIIGYSFLQQPKAKGKRRVSLKIILKPGQRGGDPDSYWKSLADGLVHAGMLTDDNRQGVELGLVEYARGTAFRWGTIIKLEDIG